MKKRHLLIICFLLIGCSKNKSDIRVGYSANLTHAQALIGLGQGEFQKRLGNEISISGQVFHAGPSIVEALFANEIDFAYVGPVPAINSVIRTNGEFIVVSGAANGGAAIVVAKDRDIRSIDALAGKKILTPQLGNTQDVMARVTFQKLKSQILPMASPDHINLFMKGNVDASWTVEPWVSRLTQETGARILISEDFFWQQSTEGEYPTTLLIARTSFLQEESDISSLFIKAHIDLTKWIQENPEEAQELANKTIENVLGERLESNLLSEAWNRIQFSWKFNESSLYVHKNNLKSVGFLREDNTKHVQFVDREWIQNQN